MAHASVTMYTVNLLSYAIWDRMPYIREKDDDIALFNALKFIDPISLSENIINSEYLRNIKCASKNYLFTNYSYVFILII